MKKLMYVFVIVGAILLAACAPSPSSVPSVEPTVPTVTAISTSSPTLMPAPTNQPTQTPVTKKMFQTNWVTMINNCGLPENRWNRELYSITKPEFTGGTDSFKVEMPEHWIEKILFVSLSRLETVAIRFPAITTGGSQKVYCRFQTWAEQHQLPSE